MLSNLLLQFRKSSYQAAIDLFEQMKSKHIPLDSVTYVCYIRAAAGIRTSWGEIMGILDEAHGLTGGDMLDVVHSAMTNLKYMNDNNDPMKPLDKLRALFDWLDSHDIDPVPKTMDVAFAVTCTHGSIGDMKAMLQQFSSVGIEPTDFTFNTLLNR